MCTCVCFSILCVECFVSSLLHRVTIVIDLYYLRSNSCCVHNTHYSTIHTACSFLRTPSLSIYLYTNHRYTILLFLNFRNIRDIVRIPTIYIHKSTYISFIFNCCNTLEHTNPKNQTMSEKPPPHGGSCHNDPQHNQCRKVATSSVNGHQKHCACLQTSTVAQGLDEMEFERGIWTAGKRIIFWKS